MEEKEIIVEEVDIKTFNKIEETYSEIMKFVTNKIDSEKSIPRNEMIGVIFISITRILEELLVLILEGQGLDERMSVVLDYLQKILLKAKLRAEEKSPLKTN